MNYITDFETSGYSVLKINKNQTRCEAKYNMGMWYLKIFGLC